MNDQESKCKCDFRIRMLGDGCRYCQPQEYIDRLHDTMNGMIHTDCFELTDEEMIRIYEKDWSGIKCGLGRAVEQAILLKASEK